MSIEEDVKLEALKHHLHIKRIFLEKGLLTIVVGIVGLIANLLLTNYKYTLDNNQYALQIKLKASIEILMAYSAVHSSLFKFSNSSKFTLPVNYYTHPQPEIINFAHKSNKWSVLFTHDFSSKIQMIIFMLEGFKHVAIRNCREDNSSSSDKSMKPCINYRYFLLYIRANFEKLLFLYVGNKGYDRSADNPPNLLLLKIKPSESRRDFFIRTFTYWKSNIQS
ncbi:MAG: hypothetical protein OEZ01_15815 [Candidatus Heimdallarchaeota archaeon]|nr:hypothetical protein [Candidatus Heimdallarchaeota archaeon]